jgi:hypothetical protein
VADRREPGRGPGGYRTASSFASLDGWTRAEADQFLRSHPELRRYSISGSGYYHCVFQDRSEIWIRPNGQVIRLPHRMYNSDGSRIEGYRINIYTGTIISVDQWHELPRSEQEWVRNNGNEGSG